MKFNRHSRYGYPEGVESHMKWFYLFLFMVVLILSNSCALNDRTGVPSTTGNQDNAENEPQIRFKEGVDAFTKGDLQGAYTLFNEALGGFRQKTDLTGQCTSSIRLAHISLSMGQTDKATTYLEEAERAALSLDNHQFLGRIYALRGNLEHVSGKPEAARQSLEKAVSIAEKHGYGALLVSLHNDLGNLFGTLQLYSRALDAYRTSAALGKKNSDSLRAAIALINAARVCIAEGDRHMGIKGAQSRAARIGNNIAIDNTIRTAPIDIGQDAAHAPTRATILIKDTTKADRYSIDPSKAMTLFADASALLEEARVSLHDAASSHHKTTAQINIGLAHMDLAERLPEQVAIHRAHAARELSYAVESARQYQNSRLLSYAIGHMGRLHRTDGRLDQAADLTGEAVYRARQANAPESLYRWQWQYARILTAQDCMADAIATYQQAIATLESIRSEFTNCYGQPRADLRKAESELYLMYVDVLLRHAPTLGPAERQNILKTARQAVERRKVFELRQYFNDDCLGASTMGHTNVDEILENAVVLYPILLPDRMEIIASFPLESSRGNPLEKEHQPRAFSNHYVTRVASAAVIKAAEAFRNTLQMKDSERYLPYARQLYDWLIRPLEQDLARAKADTLVLVPDSALRNIPMGALYDGSSFLIQSYAVAVTPGLVLTNPTALNPEKINILAVGMTSATRGFDALPGVADELEAISSLYKTTVLVDEQFSLTNLEQALQNDNYNVVHIASHGKFSEHIEDSFILAANERLTFNDLSKFVGLYRFREQPLELLTLSACETAAGNEQAALGLAGIAIKIGARSALASLWAVDDQAAAQLVSEFYRRLRQPGSSRAKALRQAKQKLLRDPIYRHPGYWSPFIMINNWL